MINSGREWDWMEQRMKQRREEYQKDKLRYYVLGGLIKVIIVISVFLYFIS